MSQKLRQKYLFSSQFRLSQSSILTMSREGEGSGDPRASFSYPLTPDPIAIPHLSAILMPRSLKSSGGHELLKHQILALARAKPIYRAIAVYSVGEGRRPYITSYITDFCRPPSYSIQGKAYSLIHPALFAERQSERRIGRSRSNRGLTTGQTRCSISRDFRYILPSLTPEEINIINVN